MAAINNSASPAHPKTLELSLCFLKLGAQGFGGLGAILTLLSRELVERRGWLRESDIAEALTFTKLLPGPAIVQIVAYLGWKLGRWPGALGASGAFLLPSFALMLGLAALYHSVGALPAVTSATRGLTAAVAGLLVVTTLTLGRKNITEPLGWALALGAGAASVGLGVHPAWLVVAAGALGVAREAVAPASVTPASVTPASVTPASVTPASKTTKNQ